jgi:hypothetical protein
MTDNTFGEELGQLPPDLTLGATSDQLMRRGRRIRTIRQSSIAGAAAVAVLGITSIAAVAAGHHGTRTVQTGSGGGLGAAVAVPSSSAPWPVPATSAPASSAWPNSSASASCSPAPQSTAAAPAATPDGNAPPWGTLVPAGIDAGTSKTVVLYGIHIDEAAIPCTHFGLMVGTEDASGSNTVTGIYAANEFSGSDLEPGFHAVSIVGTQVAATPFIGYYVGPAASISVVVNGVPTAAHVVAWSVNPDVKFWWLGAATGTPTYGALSAKDANGNPLPVGTHAQPGVG